MFYEKVSVIISMYNEELYIKSCIKSIINQSYQSLEIIIVDDGSTDQSVEISRKLSLYDERFKLLCRDHIGISAARNCGLDIATGEFVFFIDGDDIIHPCLIEKLVLQMKTYHTDLSICSCRKVDNHQMEKMIMEVPDDKAGSSCLLGDRAESEEWFHIKFPNMLAGIGGKMIRRKFIGDLRFNEELIYGEDTLFMYHLICKHPKIAYSNLKWYYYRQHIKSITHSDGVKMDERYFKSTKIIRDSEYEKGNIDYALYWEKWLLKQMEKSFYLMKKLNKKEEWNHLKKSAILERFHPLFYKIEKQEIFLFWICFLFHPLFKIKYQGLKNYFKELKTALFLSV